MIATQLEYPKDEAPPANAASVDITKYIAHPTKANTYIGRVEKLGPRRHRGLMFVKAVTYASILKGSIPKVLGHPVVRETHQKCAWTIIHKFRGANGLLADAQPTLDA